MTPVSRSVSQQEHNLISLFDKLKPVIFLRVVILYYINQFNLIFDFLRVLVSYNNTIYSIIAGEGSST